MGDILSMYLESLSQDSSDLRKLIFGHPLVIFRKDEDIKRGLLKFEKKQISKDLRFLFIFPNERERIFHTIGMKFNIDIYFFDKDGSLVNKKINCFPGIKEIKSNGLTKYVVETLADEEKKPKVRQ